MTGHQGAVNSTTFQALEVISANASAILVSSLRAVDHPDCTAYHPCESSVSRQIDVFAADVSFLLAGRGTGPEISGDGRMKLIAWKRWLLLPVLACGSPAALAANYELTLPDGNAAHIHLLPGETGSFTFDIRNLDTESGTAVGWGRIDDGQGLYTFGPGQQAGCGQPQRTISAYFALQWNFPVALGAGETKRCTYPVTRPASSLRAARFYPCIGQNVSGSEVCNNIQPQLVIGSLTDIAFSVSPIAELPVGATEAIVKITVRNLSDVDVGSFKLATACTGTPWSQLPYTLDTDFPGACPLIQPNPGCTYDWQFGVPPPVFNWLVGVSPTPANGESSCLVRIRFRQPLTAQVVDTLELRRPQHDRFPPIPLPQPAYADGRDVNSSNDGRTPFGAIAFVATPVPSANLTALTALAMTLVALAGLRNRRRKHRD